MSYVIFDRNPPRINLAELNAARRARRMFAIYTQGWTCAEISRRVGVSRQRVHQLLLKHLYLTMSEDVIHGELFIATLSESNWSPVLRRP